IRTDKEMPVRPCRDWPPLRANPRIDDRHVHRTLGVERVCAVPDQTAFKNILRSNGMRDVSDLRIRRNLVDHAAHHAGVSVACSKICQQGNDLHRCLPARVIDVFRRSINTLNQLLPANYPTIACQKLSVNWMDQASLSHE